MHWRRLARKIATTLWKTTAGRPELSVFPDRGRFVDFLKIGTPAQLKSFVNAYASGQLDLDWRASPIGYYILNDLTLEVFRVPKTCTGMWRHRGDGLSAAAAIEQFVLGQRPALPH